MQNTEKKRFKINNKGVTLVELIIAVAIFGIVVTPLLHAFITSANINAKARDTLNETILSENLMEEFNDASVEDMIDKYGGSELANGSVEFQNIDHALLNGELDTGVQVDIYLDPTTYATENDANLVDLETITSSDCAIYSMPLTYDDEIYEIFEDNSASASATNPSVYTYQDKDFFEVNLDRTIYVSFIKAGENVEGVPLVRVELSIVYEWLGAGSYLLPEDRVYTTKTKELFDNTTTEIALNALYLMFVPRYRAAQVGHYDDVRILNYENVPAKAFVVRQETTEDALYLAGYESSESGHITVIENNLNTPYTADTEAAIQLRTNMHADLLSTHTDLNPAELNCTVRYRNQTGTQMATYTDSEEILQVRTLDGKTLDNTSVKNRIYEMTIEIYTEELVAGTVVREILTTMTGTKIN